MNFKWAVIFQSIGVGLQAVLPQYVDDATTQAVLRTTVGVAQAVGGVMSLWYNPNGTSAKEPYVKYKRKGGLNVG